MTAGQGGLRPQGGAGGGAKLAAISLTGVAVALAMMATALLAAVPHTLADGAAVDLFAGDVGHTVAGTLAVAALFGVAGVGLGALFRSQLAAVVAVAAWVVVGEGVLGMFLGPDVGRWLPGRAASALAASVVEGLSLWTAAVLLSAYCAAVTSVALASPSAGRVTKRRLTVVAAAVLLASTACREGDQGRTAGNVGRYCDRLAALEGEGSRPTAGGLDELTRVAPPEIRAVRSVVEAGGTPFDDGPEATALLDRSRQLCG